MAAITKQFEGQVAIVTGGADGLGKAIVRMLAENGARVMVFDLAEDKMKVFVDELTSSGYDTRSCKVDVSVEASVKEGFSEFAKFSDRLDIMINCAGIVGPNGVKSESVAVEDFDKVYAVNLRGSFLTMKYSLVEMKKLNYGRILLIASIAGKEGNAGMSPYSASKAGVIGLVKSAGKEYATTGITINALAPAVVRTAMVEAMDPAQVKYMTDKIPMQRCCTTEELVSMTKFIVSKEASFNTGFCFDLTGGRATY
ncbi:2-dehydro-3-deoxy-L-rhamnonate dehydrogenase (NAD(+))-like [Dysidea avara]|uniref:2-dehydro-3-deoxy-L-rhamnonate dehydrogenase (NAD(+))-like n=1 Tax=Dysidea avara TaxID=196820 RepID=UPI00331DD683